MGIHKNKKGNVFLMYIVIGILVIGVGYLIYANSRLSQKEVENRVIAPIESKDQIINAIKCPNGALVTDINNCPTDAKVDNSDTLRNIEFGQCTKAGHFEEVWIKKVYSINDNALITPKAIAKFKSDSICENEFYFEAGIAESSYTPLSAMPTFYYKSSAYRSACDSNLHYAGTRLKLLPKQSKVVYFYPDFYSKSGSVMYGNYKIDVGVFSGCMDKGNPDKNFRITEYKPTSIQYNPKPSFLISADNSWERII